MRTEEILVDEGVIRGDKRAWHCIGADVYQAFLEVDHCHLVVVLLTAVHLVVLADLELLFLGALGLDDSFSDW